MSKINAEINFYRKQYPELDDLLEFNGTVFDLQQEILEKIETQIQISSEEAKKRIEAGTFLLKDEKFEIDIQLFKEILAKLAFVVRPRHNNPEQVDEILKYFKKLDIPNFLGKIVESKTIYMPEIIGDSDLDAETFFFLVRNSLVPFFKCEADNLKSQVDDSDWVKRMCPICGHEPQNGKFLLENGQYFLQCSLCLMEWSFIRMTCPFCGNDDKDSLKYLYVDEDKEHKAYVCDVCKRYIKVSDERALDRAVNLQLENIVTNYLDALVLEQGYSQLDLPKND